MKLTIKSKHGNYSITKNNGTFTLYFNDNKETIDSDFSEDLDNSTLRSCIIISLSSLSNKGISEMLLDFPPEYYTQLSDFLSNEEDLINTPMNFKEFSSKHAIINTKKEIDLKKLNLLFDDMSYSSIYRAAHDDTYKTSSALIKKIELMDFILENTSNTRYHQIIK
ncbi:hypothetical protein [Vibrio toranzoniae]|uniref:hypothetical protein n=1 Tax=Vibrio toranzoniae TaxID=1194427 RepID=UPI0013771165|nr:hypothetical protein [Vibrio toranzoniae]NAZ92250.1 hypothetical protein [Vibrio toranzoniae]